MIVRRETIKAAKVDGQINALTLERHDHGGYDLSVRSSTDLRLEALPLRRLQMENLLNELDYFVGHATNDLTTLDMIAVMVGDVAISFSKQNGALMIAFNDVTVASAQDKIKASFFLPSDQALRNLILSVL